MSIEEYIYNNFIGDYHIIKFSGLFDENWYSKEYNIKSEDLVKHFLYIGCKNNYNPSPNFDTIWYLNEIQMLKMQI